MKCLSPVLLTLLLLIMESQAGELTAIDLKDGTTLYARVVDVTPESIHLVSTRVNRKVPLDQLCPESRKQFAAPALARTGQIDDTREKLIRSDWSGGDRTTYLSRPRIIVPPLLLYPGYAPGYYPYRSHCHRRYSTFSVRIDL